MNIGKTIILLLLSSLFISCSEKQPAPEIDIIFGQSEFYIPKNCDKVTTAKIRIETVDQSESLDFEVYLEEKKVKDFTFNINPNSKKIEINKKKYVEFTFEIPPYIKFKKDQIACSVIHLNESEKVSQNTEINYVNDGQQVEYLVHKDGLMTHVKDAYWDNYKGEKLPAHRDFTVHSKTKSSTVKKDNSWHKVLSYELQLKDTESGEVIDINPIVRKEYTLNKKLNLKESETSFTSLLKDKAVTDEPVHGYETSNELNLSPGYQVYSKTKGNLITAVVNDCDSTTILNEEELVVPHKFLFKALPTVYATNN